MLKISRLADYALVILQPLAQHAPACCSATLLAGHTHLALPTVSKILKQLTTAGILASIRGTQGGYRLAKTAQEITIASVIAAFDGDFGMTECCKAGYVCEQQQVCSLSHNWRTINQVILKILSSLSVADLQRDLNSSEIIISLIQPQQRSPAVIIESQHHAK